MEKRAKTKFEKMLVENEWTVLNDKIVDSDNDAVKIKPIAKAYGIPEAAMEGVIMEYIEEIKPKEKVDTGYTQDTAIDEIAAIMKYNNFDFNIRTMNYVRTLNKTNKNGEKIKIAVSYTDVVDAIEAAIEAAKINNGGKYFVTTKALMAIMKDSTNRIVRRKQDLITETITFDESVTIQREWLTRLHKVYQIEQDFDIFEVMMKHFCWQIKRKMMDLSTQNDILLSFHGAQGIGKSFLFNNIFSTVLNDFYTPGATLQSICDPNQTTALTSQFCMNIEEMATGGSESQNRLSEKDITILKKNLTGTHTTMRLFFTQEVKSFRIRTSFISTTNKHIYEIINDDTGMRRFFEFTSNRKERMDTEEVKWIIDNSIDFFSTLDEFNDMGYWNMNDVVGKKIAEIQKGYISSSIIKYFNTISVLTDGANADGYKKLSLSELYEEYNNYCVINDVDPKFRTSRRNFKSKLEDTFGKEVVKNHSHIESVWMKEKNAVIEETKFSPTEHFKQSRASKELTSGRKFMNIEGIE